MTAEVQPSESAAAQDPGLWDLFLHFMLISAVAFGGVLPWARRKLVDDRRWLTEREFLDTLALCQFLPGPNIVNLSIAVGARFRGLPGSIAAFLGILGLPCIVVLVLGALYSRYGHLPEVGGGLLAVTAAASGMILAMAGKIATPLLRRRPVEAAPVIVAVFVTVALLRFPLPWVLLTAAPVSIGISWWRRT
ncbi:MAG: chromate transporter [Alphaproteobacteria bacterium]|nr:chromate transporter [Alphaproteobacteria bacterium]